MKPKIYIDGKEGTTGLQIYERLGGRDDIELLLIDEDKRKDIEERRKFLNAADIAFLCLPPRRTSPGWGCGWRELRRKKTRSRQRRKRTLQNSRRNRLPKIQLMGKEGNLHEF